ncbi:MAG: HPr family phosphocarrier protein [Peptococcia bacterium]
MFNLQEREFVIKNKTGLHARPASVFVKKASSYKSQITLKKGNQTVNAKSIISLLSLGAGKGDKITIITEGEDEEIAMTGLLELLDQFDD